MLKGWRVGREQGGRNVWQYISQGHNPPFKLIRKTRGCRKRIQSYIPGKPLERKLIRKADRCCVTSPRCRRFLTNITKRYPIASSWVENCDESLRAVSHATAHTSLYNDHRFKSLEAAEKARFPISYQTTTPLSLSSSPPSLPSFPLSSHDHSPLSLSTHFHLTSPFFVTHPPPSPSHNARNRSTAPRP